MKARLIALALLLGLALAETPDMIFHPFFVNTYPDPALPGNEVRVEVTLENWGSQSFYNISTELEPSWPFTGIKTTGFVPRLDPGQRATVVYILNVSKNADPGQYKINHRIVYWYGEWNEATDKMDYFKVESVRTVGINVENKERVEVLGLDYPHQLLPGETGIITARIKNTGNVAVNDISISVDGGSSYIYVLAPTVKYIDTLGPGSEEKLNFTVRASDITQSGSYEIDLTVKYGETTYSYPMFISVIGYPGVEVSKVEFARDPEPGKETNITICLRNLGTSSLENLYASLLPSYSTSTSAEELTGQSITVQSTGIAVIGSGTRFVRSLDPGRETCLDYRLAVSDSTKEGPTTMYLSLTGGNFQNEMIPIGVNIRGVPKLAISDLDENVDIIYTGEPFKLSVQFENVGTGEAKEVKVVLGKSTVYLGSIDPKDTSTAVFRTVLHNSGENMMDILVSYKDKDGETYHQKFSISLNANRKPLPVMTIVILVLILAAIAVIAYRRFKG